MRDNGSITSTPKHAEGVRPSVLSELARFAAGVSVDSLPRKVVDKAKLCILDTVSSCLTIDAAPKAQAALRTISFADGKGTTTVYGTPHRASMIDAAFVNAISAACPSRSDTHPGPASHPGLVVIPSVLAIAEAKHRSGRSAVEGVIIGYELMCRLGRALITPEVSSIFRPTGLTAPTAAAIGAAHVAGFDVLATVNAGSLGTHTASGFNEWARAETGENVYHAGFAARNALTAVLLAEAGVTAAPTILEGRSGLLAGHGALERVSKLTEGLGETFEILNISYKVAPACVYVQTACQLAEQMSKAHKIKATDIASIEVGTSQTGASYPGCDNDQPIVEHQGAKNSIQFSVATVFCSGGIRDSNWLNFHAPEPTELASRSVVVVDKALTDTFPRLQGARIKLKMRNGESIEQTQDDLRPLTSDEIIARFVDYAEPRIGRSKSHQFVELVQGMEHLQNITALASLARLSA